MSADRVMFQVRCVRGDWRVEYLAKPDDEDVRLGLNSPGWQPLIRGFASAGEAIQRLRTGWLDVRMHPVSLDGTFAAFPR